MRCSWAAPRFPPVGTARAAACIPLVTTYGMSGDRRRLRVRRASAERGRGVHRRRGRVVLSGGPMVAHGYHRRSDPAFAVAGSFRTDDPRPRRRRCADRPRPRRRRDQHRGLTVVPRVVEDVLAADPAVAQCAVVGVPDERLGEEIVALVVAEPGRTRTRVVARQRRAAGPPPRRTAPNPSSSTRSRYAARQD